MRTHIQICEHLYRYEDTRRYEDTSCRHILGMRTHNRFAGYANTCTVRYEDTYIAGIFSSSYLRVLDMRTHITGLQGMQTHILQARNAGIYLACLLGMRTHTLQAFQVCEHTSHRSAYGNKLFNKKILKSPQKKNLMEACTGTSFICSLKRILLV